MKTAVSMEARLLNEADTVARLMGLSRSALFARAVADFLERRRQEQIVAQLDAVYGKPGSAQEMTEEKLLLEGMKQKMSAVLPDQW